MRKLYYVIISIILAIACLAGNITPVGQAFANSINLNFENTYVLDDLDGVKIRDKEFEVDDYPLRADADVELLTLHEYGYSYYASNASSYALYVYVYNPAQYNIQENSILNTIQIGVEFDVQGNPSKYNKFGLRFVNVSLGSLARVFYKYRVIDTNNVLLGAMRAYANTNNGTRSYNIGEIELRTSGENNATAYEVGKSYNYSGYLAGFGKSDGSSLELSMSVLETLQLEVQHTFYRPKGVQSPNSNIQDQLNSVYFAIPNELLIAYGTMYAAHIEWYEYLTKEILVTGTSTVYNKLKSFVGQKISTYNETAYYGFAADLTFASLYSYASVIYNTSYPFVDVSHELETLYYIFFSGLELAKDYIVSSEDLLSYMLDYSQKNNSYDVRGKYSSNLFYDNLPEGRQLYNNCSITESDEYTLESHVLSQNWWEKLLGIKNYRSSPFDGIKGIQRVNDGDLEGSAETVSNKLYINENDYSSFLAFYNSAKADNKTVFLLRFAVTDYYSVPVTQIRDKLPPSSGAGYYELEIIDTNAYLARETVFLDFDVIDVTFHKDGTYTTIPVVTNPIDIIPDITPPIEMPEGCNDWKKTLSIILLLVIVVLVVRPLMGILSFILWVIKYVLSLVFSVLSVLFVLLGITKKKK